MAEKVKALRGIIYTKFDSEANCAKAMGWHRQKLSKITNGTKIPDLFELEQLSKALDVPLSQLAKIFLTQKSPIEQPGI
ncbi:MAG: helix-turn-helix transcriptional regulator [Clostridiales bacterium]|nr:helix-turn-helix transcriptional regulator [Clostridiales bacterium]